MAAGSDRIRKAFERLTKPAQEKLDRRLLTLANSGDADDGALLGKIQKALEAGANINARDAQGNTPVALLCAAGMTRAAMHLMVRGADVNIPSLSGMTPLMDAATHCNAAMMKLLLSHKADPKLKDNAGEDALKFLLDGASEQRAKDAVTCLRLLMSHGIALHPATEREIHGDMPYLAPAVPDVQDALDLAKAVKDRDHGRIKQLMDRGVDPDIGVRFGDNASLIYLSSANDVEGMKLLLDAGAKVNLVSPMVEKTPLINAATHGSKEACALLIERGADVTIEFKPGLVGGNAIDFARNSKVPGLGEYIADCVAARAWRIAHPPPPDVSLAQDIKTLRRLRLKPGPAA